MKGVLSISKSQLTIERVREMLDYNTETGIVKWKKKPNKNTIIGQRAGSIKRDNYRYLRIDNIEYLEYRLIWFGMTGNWPKNQIDHIDLDKSNNKWNNLREATVSQNGMNTNIKISNNTGYKGVDKIKNGKFRVRIRKNNKELL